MFLDFELFVVAHALVFVLEVLAFGCLQMEPCVCKRFDMWQKAVDEMCTEITRLKRIPK
jgi:hypothetical protein